MSIDDNIINFETTVLRILDKYAPLKKRLVKGKKVPPWFHANHVEMRKAKDDLKRRAFLTSDSKIWNEYKKAKNNVNASINNAKRKYFNTRFTKATNSTCGIYSMS